MYQTYQNHENKRYEKTGKVYTGKGALILKDWFDWVRIFSGRSMSTGLL
jgi:hypothetical protein